nr:hypothetical protein [Tanacetum cinerariifolium]
GDIPQPLSQLVLKLIAKNPDDRYQSAGSLLADLRSCKCQWHQFKDIPDLGLDPDGDRSAARSEFRTAQARRQEAILTSRTSVVIPGGQDTLDLASVMKAAQALSEETDQDRLIEMLMSTTIMHAGAQRAVLLLVKSDAPVICAMGQGCDNGLQVQLVRLTPGKHHL